MDSKQIVFIFPLAKETKNRYKYATEGDREAFKETPVGGQLYPLKDLLLKQLGKVPQRIKVTIEEAL